MKLEENMSQELVEAIVDMREQDALKITDEMLESGSDPFDVLDAGREAMGIIGQRFEAGEYFVPELMLAGEVLKQISEKVKPLLEEEVEEGEKLGKVVIGTVQGDIHDIGKDLVVFMLDINGFDVQDVGVDVSPEAFVEAAQAFDADIVGLSGFLTLAYEPMKATVVALKEAGLSDVKVMIGGGQVDEQVRDYTGADAYGTNAMAAVSQAKAWVGAN
jgi:5-methyltetrahydrofolate--homocysteine methyltransferase